MIELTLKIVHSDGTIAAVSTGDEYVGILYTEQYQDGDMIVLESSQSNVHLVCQVDDALGENQIYLTGTSVSYRIPFGEKRRSHAPKTFCGDAHYLFARIATEDELHTYRNLAYNSMDQHEIVDCYPHASANVETRGESVFAARNAIDGILENHGHGSWPYTSWGINCNPNACIRIDFGRRVCVDKIVLFTRADFPHDNWWKHVTFTFSDGTTENFAMQKSDKGQIFKFEQRDISWVTMDRLIMSDDPSPFPALSQIQIYGTEI